MLVLLQGQECLCLAEELGNKGLGAALERKAGTEHSRRGRRTLGTELRQDTRKDAVATRLGTRGAHKDTEERLLLLLLLLLAGTCPGARSAAGEHAERTPQRRVQPPDLRARASPLPHTRHGACKTLQTLPHAHRLTQGSAGATTCRHSSSSSSSSTWHHRRRLRLIA